MRILLPATDFPPTRGGIQSLLKEFVTRTRHDVRVIAPRDAGWQGADAAFAVKVRRVGGIGGTGRRVFVPAITLATASEIRRFKPDVVFAGHVIAAFGSLPFLRRTPLVVGTYGVELIAPNGRRAARIVLPRADRVLAVSRFTMEAARALGAKRGEVIPVGAPDPRNVTEPMLQAFRATHRLDGARVLLTVARLEPHKGIDVVIRALPSLPADVRYLVVGSGATRAAFEAEAARAGVADRVVFAGGVSDEDLAAAYRVADVFVLASRSLDGGRGGVEGCPVSLLEAAAYGLPIVAARTGGISDAVRDGETGILVDPERIPDIAEALNRALDPSVAKPLADAAEKSAKAERNWAVVVERMERLLEEAVSSRRH